MKDLPINLEYNIATFPNLQLNFWGIPKCGSTTMKHILIREDNPNLFNQYNRRRTGSKHWSHGKCKYIIPEQARQNGFKNFTILREPVQRLYSMYKSLDRLKHRMDGGDDFKQDMDDFFQKPNVLDFVELLSRHSDKERNIHFRSQKSYCIFDDIVKLDLSNVSSTIRQIHPSLVVDITLNKTEQTQTPDDIVLNAIHRVFKEDFNLWAEVK